VWALTRPGIARKSRPSITRSVGAVGLSAETLRICLPSMSMCRLAWHPHAASGSKTLQFSIRILIVGNSRRGCATLDGPWPIWMHTRRGDPPLAGSAVPQTGRAHCAEPQIWAWLGLSPRGKRGETLLRRMHFFERGLPFSFAPIIEREMEPLDWEPHFFSLPAAYRVHREYVSAG
jgi:hypothetical protein